MSRSWDGSRTSTISFSFVSLSGTGEQRRSGLGPPLLVLEPKVSSVQVGRGPGRAAERRAELEGVGGRERQREEEEGGERPGERPGRQEERGGWAGAPATSPPRARGFPGKDPLPLSELFCQPPLSGSLGEIP